MRRHLENVVHKRFILAHREDLPRGDFLVDGRPGKRGAAEFGRELVHFGPKGRFPDWPVVARYIRAKAWEG